MPIDENIVELKVMLAQQSVVLQTLQSDCKEIKLAMVPNGKERVKELEKEVKLLHTKSSRLTGMGVLLVGAIPFLPEILKFIKGG